jgi:hypothetical protein
MAIYRIYPDKDVTLYSEAPTSNTGKDEILEIAGYEDTTGTARTTRTLISFDTDEVKEIIDTKVNGSNYSASIHLYLAEASEIPVSFSIEGYPVSKTWDEGRGKFGDIPIDISGASWSYTLNGGEINWISSSFMTGETGSYISGQTGGGSWFFEISGSPVELSQAYINNSNLDINLNVTSFVNSILSNEYPNNGLILKLENDFEFNTESNIKLRYFSSDTNTIYRPYLEIKWDDSEFITGSNLPLLSDNIEINLKNGKQVYFPDEVGLIKINTRPRYPTRVFTTSSVYLTQYFLPPNSYWSMKDYYTGEVVVPFDDNFTKISCNENGSYFKFFFSSLESERYYILSIKTIINGSTRIIDIKNPFKVSKNG